MTDVLVYTRVSIDTGTDGVGRQESACRAYAAAMGWNVVGVRTDTDASAYRPGAQRPGFESLVEQAHEQACDGILVWKFDRLVRRPSDFEHLLDTADSSGLFLTSVLEPFDSSTPLGVALLRMLVALAGLESATLGIRVAAARRSAAEAGRYPRRKVFGLTADGSEIEPAEAAVLREAVDRLLAGEAVAQVANGLHRRGHRSTTGGRFSVRFLVDVLESPRIAGDLVHRGGIVTSGCYPSIIERETWQRVQLVLARRAAGDEEPAGSRLARPLNGLLRCGRCGEPLVTRYRGGLTYKCPPRPECGGVTVRADPLDRWVLATVAERMHRQGKRGLSGVIPRREPMEIVDALRVLVADHHAGRIGREEFTAARTLLLRAADSACGADEVWVRRLFRAKDRNRAVSKLTLEQQRVLLSDQIDVVVIHRAIASGSLFDPWRCAIGWRTPEPSCDTVPARRPNEEEVVLDIVREVSEQRQGPLSKRAYDLARPPLALNSETLARRFGSWETVLSQAGLGSTRRRYGWTYDEAVTAIESWRSTVADPSLAAYLAHAAENRDLPTMRVLQRLFGSWRAGREAVEAMLQ